MDDEELMYMENLIAIIMANMEDEDDKALHGDGWEVVPVDVEAYRTMGDPSFQLHFRMTKTTFEELLQTVGNHMVENRLILRQRTPLDLMMLHTLWILATPDSFRSVALRFGVRPGVIHTHYVRIIGALCDLAPRFISWPNRAERKEIKTSFQNYSGFPGIIGCIDGTYVVMTAPTIQPRRYINRHHQFSFNIQLECDHRLLVLDAHVGEPGAISDARVFRKSPLCRKLLTDPNMLDPDDHLIGGIYMLTAKLLTPYRNNGHLLPEQRVFNYRLTRCRSRVEHCNAKFFSQLRRLKFLQSFNIEFAVQTIVAYLVLHTFMILQGEEVADYAFDDLNEDEEEDLDILDDYQDALDYLPLNVISRHHPMLRMLNEARRAGVQKREHITALLQ